MKKLLFIILVSLLWMGCASGPDYAPVVATAMSMEKEVKTFPAVVNGKHVMDIKFQYLGNKPMDPTTEIKGIPPGQMRNAHFYYYEMVNLTDHTMEIFAYHSTGRMITVDESGMRKTSPPRWLNREELLRTMGLKSMRIDPRGRRIVRDTWLYCSQPPCKIVNTYKIRILETDEVFSIKIVKKG
jgi:hypothetical protein